MLPLLWRNAGKTIKKTKLGVEWSFRENEAERVEADEQIGMGITAWPDKCDYVIISVEIEGIAYMLLLKLMNR